MPPKIRQAAISLCLVLFTSLFAPQLIAAPLTLWSEDFETNGSGTRYTPSEECNDQRDFFTRTDGSDIGQSFAPFVYNSPNNTYFWAANDTNHAPCSSRSQSIIFQTFTISGSNSFTFKGLFAEDDSEDNKEDWDNSTSVRIEYQIDGGAWTPVLQFEAVDGNSSNEEPAEDTNFDGVGDGTRLTPDFAEFTKSFIASGTTMTVAIRFENLDSHDEDIALDYLRIEADPTLTLTIAASDINESDSTGATTATVTRNTDTTAALNVNLNSNDTSEATVPASVNIPAGQASVTFDIAAVDDALVDGTQTVEITASAAGHADGKDSVDVSDDERDNDSASDTDELAAPNGGDGNGDGTPDVDQNNVASFPAVVTGGGSNGSIYYTVELDTDGGASSGCTPVNDTGATTEAALGGDSADFDYLAGLLTFTLNCAQAEIVLYFHGLSSAPIAIRKYSPATYTWYNMPGASIETVTINGQTVYKATYTLTDGGVGDDDGVVNGTIVDPVGPAWAAAGAGGAGAGGAGSSAQNIPVFGPFGLLAMLLGLAWFGQWPLKPSR